MWKREYKHPGITDENIKLQYGMNDKELDKLIFSNYQKYALIMEHKNKLKDKHVLINICTHGSIGFFIDFLF